MTADAIPMRFEDEFPEEAETLMKICGNKTSREKVQWFESKFPRCERIFDTLSDMKLSILGWKHMVFGKSKKDKPYTRLKAKVGRNEKCPCGSGKKYKKCCIMEE